MVNESAKQQIATELRSLRGQPGPLDTAKLTSARAILKGFGGDDPDVALVRLTDLAAEHAKDREVEAAMASFGWGSTLVGTEDRLDQLAKKYFVDRRTARRWSDEGIRKLTLLILGSAPWIQPRARQLLEAVDDVVTVQIHIAVPAGLRMGVPELWVGREPLEIRMPEFEFMERQQDLRTSVMQFASVDELPVELRLHWQGEKLPIYESLTHGSRYVVFKSRLVFSGLRTTICRSILAEI